MKKEDLIDFLKWHHKDDTMPELIDYDYEVSQYLKSKNLTPQREAGIVSRNENTVKLCDCGIPSFTFGQEHRCTVCNKPIKWD